MSRDHPEKVELWQQALDHLERALPVWKAMAGDEAGTAQRILDEITKCEAAMANAKPHNPERGC